MCSLAENIQNITDPVAHGVYQVVTLLGDTLLVADRVQRIDHKIDRNNVDPPPFQADGWHPWREQLAHALNQLEKVIRTIDLVHLAGSAVADHHGGAVHRPRHLAFFAHDFFTLVLGHKVGMVVVLRFFKHILAEYAFVQTRGSNRRHMVEMPRVDGFGELHRVSRAVYIHRDLRFLISLQVINRGQMVEVIHLPFQGFDGLCRYPEFFSFEIAKNRNGPPLGLGVRQPPILPQPRYLFFTFLPDQEMHRSAFALQQLLDQTFTNESCSSRDEIPHTCSC